LESRRVLFRSFPMCFPRHLGRRLFLYGIASERPVERVAFMCVPALDKRHDLLGQVLGGREVVVLKTPSSQDREEDLNLIHPRGMLGSVDELEFPPVASVEAGPTLLGTIIVGVEVVPNDDDPSSVAILVSDL